MKEEIITNERILKRIQNELTPLKKEEIESRRLWTLGYKKYMSATKALNDRRKKSLTTDAIKGNVTNLTVKKLWETIDGWDQKSEELTLRRDAAREAMHQKEEEIRTQEELLSEMLHAQKIQVEQTDGIVDKVFILNDGVVASLENMDKYLAADVFPHLHEKATQKMIENSTSTKKVVIMTNSINIMDVAKVEEAKQEIDAFFTRINPTKDVTPEDDTIAMLSDLLKELLVVKIKVKAGPNLSKFLGMELNGEKFPELKKAQRLLASATNYVRSGKYVRLYIRDTKDDVWQAARQS
ncbi:MAG: hypothetical protein NT085_02115 [candidate division SR1 bacterium]|nr:hypothetical protein [candidate division SR1 bacterium]